MVVVKSEEEGEGEGRGGRLREVGVQDDGLLISAC